MLPPSSFGGSDYALVPAGQLPSSGELAVTNTDSGPRAFRPRRVKCDGMVHLCEHVACRLPPQNFWEKQNSRGGGKPDVKSHPID
jgi:hypothetical protein